MRTSYRGGGRLRLAIALIVSQLVAASASAQVEGTNAEVASCRVCHISSTSEGVKSYVDDFKSQEYIRLNESKTWFENDPHILAYKQIDPANNEVAKRMETLLAGDNQNYKITQDVRCLTCHATDLKPTSKEPRQLKEFVARDTIGVGCNTCHGVQRDWQTDHFGGETVTISNEERYPKWRTSKFEVKELAGMRNLRDPHVKADLCASCHVGNPDENKVITHEMYAAGHPPLPPMELITFMQDEPRHWGFPMELPFLTNFAKKDPKQAWEIFRFKSLEKENYLARHLAAGAIASLKAEMKLLEAEANRAAKDGDGLDYARYDCYSCHHDLKYPSARQERGYGNRTPGRPPLKAWTIALPGTVVAHAGKFDETLAKLSAQFPTAWDAVSKSSTATPFAYGKGQEVAKNAQALIAWTKDFNKALENVEYSDAATDQLIAAIGDTVTSPQWYGDTEATMHLTWAFRSLQLAKDKNYAKLQPLKDLIPIQLRSKEAWENKGKPVPAGDLLPERLQLFANFDPRKFNEMFSKIR